MSDANPITVSGESARAHRRHVRWSLVWLTHMIVCVPLAYYLYGIMDAFIPPSKGSMQPWMQAFNLATMFTIMKWWMYPDMGARPRTVTMQNPLALWAKFYAISILVAASLGALTRYFRGQPSWTLILVSGVSIPLSLSLATYLFPRSNYNYPPELEEQAEATV